MKELTKFTLCCTANSCPDITIYEENVVTIDDDYGVQAKMKKEELKLLRDKVNEWESQGLL